MTKPLIKIIATLLIVGLNWAGISAVGQTLAYFSDIENSDGNTYNVATLDFSLSSSGDFSPLVTPVQSTSRAISVINHGSLGFEYTVYANEFSGDTNLCDILQLKANLDGEEKYNGSLAGFTYDADEFSDPEDWQFTASLPSDNLEFENKTCNFKFVFEGVQLGDCVGFSDTEKIENTIISGQWGPHLVINKVYYDVDAEHGTEPKNEWIELYNPGNQAVCLKNWDICDNNDCINISPNVSISALGYALVSHDNTTWKFWEIDINGVITIHQLGGGYIAMDNTADMLLLKNPDSYIIDQMNWGTPTSTWSNYNTNVWNPGVPDAPEGWMLGRVPTGFDTDQVSDWQGLGLPSVTVLVPNGGETWYIGVTYTLQWTAINPNGNDNELSIDIWYSADSGKTWANIVKGTENDGAYDWRAALCIELEDGSCYFVPSHNARIKVVATGPENFMIQSWDMSDEDFCPPIDYTLLSPEEVIYMQEVMGINMEGIMGIGSNYVGNTTTEEPTSNEANELFNEELDETINEEPIADLPDVDILETDTPAQDEIIIIDVVEEATTTEPVESPAEATTTEEIATTTEPADAEAMAGEEEPPAEEPVVEEPVVEEPVTTPDEPIVTDDPEEDPEAGDGEIE